MTLPPSPPARRHRPRGWRDPKLLVGVLVVALSVLFGATLLGRADDSVGVWAARTDLDRGQPVSADELVVRQVRFADPAAADRYLAAAAVPAPGSVLRRPVGSGELVPRAAIGSGPDNSVVEVPLAVAAAAVPATVRVGSTVDVWVTPDDNGASTGKSASLVFHDVRVLSAAGPSGSLDPTRSRRLIVGLDARQSADLPRAIAALTRGTVLVTRRP